MNRYHFDDVNHIHYLGEKPLTGTSSVSKVISMGGAISWWSAARTVELLGWTHPKKTPSKERIKTAAPILQNIQSMTVPGYLELLDLAYKNHKVSLDDSADKGIDLHAELEHFVKAEIDAHKPTPITMADNTHKLVYLEQIQPFIDWSKKNVKDFLWSEAHCYSEQLWVGGIVDAGCELNDGSIAIIDFKSSKAAYMSSFIQTAGYLIQIEENGLFDALGNQIMKLDKPIAKLIVVPFGAKEVIPVENKLAIAEYIKGFKSALDLYRLISLDEKEV